MYFDSKIVAMFKCGYDPKGNLYVDGQPDDSSIGFQFAELPKGKKNFIDITLKGGTINFPGQIQWDGKHVAVGGQDAQGSGSPETSAIYQTTGARAKIVGKTPLKDSYDVGGFYIQGQNVVAADSLAISKGGYALFYKYPTGGKPTKTISKGID